jgi:hypothetical protein
MFVVPTGLEVGLMRRGEVAAKLYESLLAG